MPINTTPLRDYSEQELRALPADSRLLFADNVSNGILTWHASENPSNTHRRRRVLQDDSTVTPQQFKQVLSHIRALRCISRGISSFSLYPTTEQQCQVNNFLWRAANNVSFDAREAATLFQRTVFIISMPSTLFDYLTKVTWTQLEDVILFTLTNLANGSNGLHVLRNELAPSLASRLDHYLPDADPQSTCDPIAFRNMLDYVMDRIVSVGPWIVPTTLCYLSASDMTELLAQRYDRPIFATPERFELMHSMVWNIYRDWQTYREVLVQLGGRTRPDALETMANTISRRAQGFLDQSIRVVLRISSNMQFCDETSLPQRNTQEPPSPPVPAVNSYLSLLPTDVVLGKLIPKLCDVYSTDDDCHRMAASSSPTLDVPTEPTLPASVPFSLKHLVLEDRILLQLYRSCDPDDDEEMREAEEPPHAVSEDSENEIHPQEPERRAEPGAESPRRRRLDEQGSFHRVSNDTDSDSSPDVSDALVEIDM